MNEGSQTIHYQMGSETDLTDKADKFLNKIVRLKSLGHSMNLSIKYELNSSKWELIKVIYYRLEKHSNYSKQYYEATEHSMHVLSRIYTDIVNSNRFQTINIYYDIIEINRA